MKKISLSQGKVAFVDDEDFEFLLPYRWRVIRGKSGIYYAVSSKKVNGEFYMHRSILGGLTKSQWIDHRNRNGLDNRKENLRICSPSQNHHNKKFLKTKDRTSIYKGVCRYKDNGKWSASIQVNKKKIHLGLFKTESEAALAYNSAAKKHFGEFAYLNEIRA